jgi:indolepyruvate ferredoxin oxidoreductase, beta subunit
MNERSVTNIVLAGVGGQGSILATRIIAAAAKRAGYEVVTSEVHGMSQRGGTVVTTVRYGRDVLAPVIPAGEADILVAFERLEAARHLELLRPGGTAVVNDQRITPALESMKFAEYPKDLEDLAESYGVSLQLFPAIEIAQDLGEVKLTSAVLLGALSNVLDFPMEAWKGAIYETVPVKLATANYAAFVSGEEWGVGPVQMSF